MLNLTIGKQISDYGGEQILEGTLVIGDFTEDFHASTSYWDRKKYLSQWRRGLEAIRDGSEKSAVITDMYDPATANFIFWWVMYRLGGDIYIQNHVLFMEDLDKPFSERNLHEFIPERDTVTEEGEPISEWKVSLTDVQQALTSLEE